MRNFLIKTKKKENCLKEKADVSFTDQKSSKIISA